jgi:hypothetical protein
MASPLTSNESGSEYSAHKSGPDERDAFTRREQLEQAKAEYNREKQVRVSTKLSSVMN